MVYALLLERVDRHLATVMAAAAAGVEPDDQPGWSFSQDSVDAWLIAVPKEASENDELLRALGVR